MAETVKIVIDADDKASESIRSVHNAMDKLAGLGKTALLGGAAVATAAIAGLGSVLIDSVQAAMEAQEAQAQLAAVIKSTGGAAGISTEDINKWAEALSDATAVEDDAIVAASSVLLTFTKINKDAFPRSLELALDMSKAFGQDLQSSVIQLGKALNDPIEGLGALSRIGVQFSESQVALIKTLMGDNEQLDKLEEAARKAGAALPELGRDLEVARLKLHEMEVGGKKSESQLLAQKNKIIELEDKIKLAGETIKGYEAAQKAANTGMSEGARLAKAQGVVMDELARQVGGSAEAFGDTFAGKLQNFNNKLGDVKETIGAALIPALDTLVTELGPKLLEWVGAFADWVEKDGAKAIADFADGFLESVPKIEEFAKALFEDNLKDIQDFIAFVGDIAEEIGKLGPVIEGFTNDYLIPMRDTFKEIWEAILQAIEALRNWWDVQGGKFVDPNAGAYGRGGTYVPPAPPPGYGGANGNSMPFAPALPPGYYGANGNSMPFAPVFHMTFTGNADPRATRHAVLDALSLARARGMV